MKPALLVLAAGMGSRYGGLKQVDPVGPSGETIVDYSIHDALAAGFGRVVFVIRSDIEEAFREAVGRRFEKKTDVAYAFQELDMIPTGFLFPPARTKPWGTGHAILVAENAVCGPFAVINGDDFYGAASFRALAGFLTQAESPDEYAMVGFTLRNTLSEHGTVSRGVCECDARGFLRSVTEYTRIARAGTGGRHTGDDGTSRDFTGDERVSMNLWGFTPSIFARLRGSFVEFLKQRGSEEKSEFYIPAVVNRLVAEGSVRVKVLPTDAEWFGVTYPEDRPRVAAAVRRLVEAGAYPKSLA